MEIIIETLVAGVCTYALFDGDKVVLRGQAPTSVIARAQVKSWLLNEVGPFRKYQGVSTFCHASSPLAPNDFSTGEIEKPVSH